MASPSRTAEARRAERERNADSYQRWYDDFKDRLSYSRRILAAETGVGAKNVPDNLAQARLEHIQLKRLIKDEQERVLYPLILEAYKSGATTRELAERFNFDRARVSAILRASGVIPKMREACPNGHLLAGENLASTRDGYRRCRQCSRDNARRHYQKKRFPKSSAVDI